MIQSKYINNTVLSDDEVIQAQKDLELRTNALLYSMQKHFPGTVGFIILPVATDLNAISTAVMYLGDAPMEYAINSICLSFAQVVKQLAGNEDPKRLMSIISTGVEMYLNKIERSNG